MTSKMTDPKMMTITFRREQTFELDFEEWYANQHDDKFKTEAAALKQWKAMCEDNTEIREVEDDSEFGYDDCECDIEFIEEETKVEDEEEKAARLKAEAERAAQLKAMEEAEKAAMKAARRLALMKQLAELDA